MNEDENYERSIEAEEAAQPYDGHPISQPTFNPYFENRRKQDIRLQCLHAALHPNLPSLHNVDDVIEAAQKLVAFVEGAAA